MKKGIRMKGLERQIALLLIMVLVLTGSPWQHIYGASKTTLTEYDDIRAAVETIEDEAAKAEILAALEDGAEVTLTCTEDGRVSAYRIVREGVSKEYEDMSEEEKAQALALLIEQGTVSERISVDGVYYALNETLWMEQGIIVYGDTAEVNQKVSVTSGANYKDGQYRYWGYDINGGLYGNDDFPRDSDSGTPAYEKDWLTTEEIRESAVARGYIGEHGLNANGRYSETEKRKTAAAWLEENPAWTEAGLDEDYIIEHFYFNSVLTENGLTNGQFTGVHLSRQSGTLYYQSFSVQGEVPVFVVTEGTIQERVLIEDESTETPGEAEEGEEEEISDVTVEVELGAPAQTYVGHPTVFSDRSVFTVDGEVKSATRVYADGLATSRFRLPQGGGRIQKSSSVPTRAEGVFDTAGNHTVRLTVTPKGGSGVSDTKTIEVLDVPAIGHSLTGTQKENRKQVLNLWVATHPDRPLEELTVTITDPVHGESVTLKHHLGQEAGTANELENSEGIKTRPIEGLESDELFTNCKLEFLTKNREEQTYQYTVTVRDSGGKTDTVSKEFTVKPDLPPEMVVDLEPAHLREAGTNTARIVVSDETTTDGDQLERTWLLAEDAGAETPAFLPLAFEDLSFGSKKDIAFEQTGVGEFKVQLKVTEVWTEPTLEEYVAEDDRHQGEITVTAEVINVAPQVSLEPVDTKTADLLFLATDPAIVTEIKSQLTDVRTMLLEQGIDGELRAEQILPTEDCQGENESPWKKTLEVDTPFGYQGSWTPLYERNNFIADDRRLYKIDATWKGSEMEYYPESPYTITAWNGETGEVDWTYTFTSDVISVPNSGPYFAQDDTETYLYFVSGDETLILDKDTGALLTKLPLALGTVNFVENNRIITVKSDGIDSIHTVTGAVTRIYSGTLGGGAARYGGRLQCVVKINDEIYRGKLDLTTHKMEFQVLEGTAGEDSSYSVERFCTDGTMLIKEVNGSTMGFTLYSAEGEIIGSHSYTADRLDAMAAMNGSGNVEYVVYTMNSKSSDTYKTTLICGELKTGKTVSTSLTNSNGYPAEDRLIMAEQIGSTVYGAAGGYITWIANYGWGNGPAHGYPQRTRTARFDMSGGTGSIVDSSILEMDDRKEYGKRSDVYSVIHSGQNGQYQSPPSGNITALYRRAQTLEEAEERLTRKYLGTGTERDLQKAFVLTREDLEQKTLAQLVEEQLDYEAMDQSSYVKLTAEGEDGSLCRTMTLDPNTTYYYEYDLYTPEGEESARDIFSVDAELERVTEEHLTGIQYRVEKTTVLSEEKIEAATSPEKSKVKTARQSVAFTVEDGKKAVLSFDYWLKKYSSTAYLADYVLIDGVRWKMAFNNAISNSGHYTHPFLLEPGDHTLEVVARSYGTIQSVFTIDDLKIEYVEEGAPELDVELQSQIRPLGNGWSRVNGSFTTPQETVAYESVEGTVQVEDAGTGGFTTTSMYNDRTTRLNLVEPTTETAIYTSIETTSKPLQKGTRNFSVNWIVGGVTYYAYPSGYWETNDKERLSNVEFPHAHDFVLSDHRSNPVVQMVTRGSTYNGFSSGTMDRVIMASVVEPTQSTAQRRYFLDMDQRNIMTANLNFLQRGSVGFVPAELSGAGVTNLRIYTVKDGIRHYAAEEDITDPNQLQRWTENNLTAEPMADGAPVEEPDSMVYAKGQLVNMEIHYTDYENDPSKESYWTYTHEPFNDGLHPLAGQKLTEPIQRFYVDGKYILEHYQVDSTGDPTYDKASNVATVVFYIGGAGEAPWIKSITVVPTKPEAGSPLTVHVAVDDAEKDPLCLRVELYKEGTLVKEERFSDLEADGDGNYPVSVMTPVTSPEAGSYEVICIVTDETGTGIANRQFTVIESGRIEGEVTHTEAWEKNRRTYNTNLFGTEASLYNNEDMTLEEYLSYAEPRPRGKNVFWAGEELVLTAKVGGSPTSVTAEAGGYTARMTFSGKTAETGDKIYVGSLWSSDMRTAWGKTPEEVTVTFKAYYASGECKEHKVNVILDSNVEYWLLHRYF